MYKKRLVILTPGFYEQAIGGAEYQTYLLSKSAKELDWEVHHIYIAISNPSNMPNFLELCLHPIYPIKNKLLRIFGQYIPLFSLFKTWIYLKQIKPDVVYCRSGVPQAGLGAYYSKRYKAKSIWQVASIKDVDPNDKKNLCKPFDYISKLILEYGIKNSQLVLAQAKYQQVLLQQYYNKSSESFRNLLPEPHEIINKSDTVFKIVWIANIKTLKRVDLFIELAKSLVKYDDMEFLIIGKNQSGGKISFEDSIKELAHLKYLGEMGIDEVNETLSKSHILVNTSEYEGFSNTFIQAWMREVVVCSLNVNPDNLLTEGKIGFCCNKMEILKETILALYTNSVLRDEIRDRAKHYAIQNHSLEKNSYRIREILSINKLKNESDPLV